MRGGCEHCCPRPGLALRGHRVAAEIGVDEWRIVHVQRPAYYVVSGDYLRANFTLEAQP